MAACYQWSSETILLGPYLECALNRLWPFVVLTLITVSIVLFAWLLLKTYQNRENPKVLPEVMQQWQYFILLPLVVIGLGSFVLNIIFQLFGLPTVGEWWDTLTSLLQDL